MKRPYEPQPPPPPSRQAAARGGQQSTIDAVCCLGRCYFLTGKVR